MKKILFGVFVWLLMCGSGFAATFNCTDYWHDYSWELKVAIQNSTDWGDPLHLTGFCRIDQPIFVEGHSSYPSLTLYGDGMHTTTLWFTFDDDRTAFEIRGGANRMPVVLRNFRIARNNDGWPRGAKNLLIARADGFEVTGLTITGSNGFSLAIQDSQFGRVHDNYVGWTARGSGADGIHIEAPASNIVVEGNTVAGCGDDGISVGSHVWDAYAVDVVINGNTVLGGDRGGIKVHEGGTNIVVSNNIVDSVAMHCFAVETAGYSNTAATSILFSGNVAKNCGTHGYYVNRQGSPIDKVAIINNVSENTGAAAVRNVGGTRATLEDNIAW
jgi:hypothetical protein